METLRPFPLPKPTQRAFLLQRKTAQKEEKRQRYMALGEGLGMDIFNERQENVQHKADRHGFKVTNHLL